MPTLFYILFAFSIVTEIFTFVQPGYYKPAVEYIKNTKKGTPEYNSSEMGFNTLTILLALASQTMYMILTIIGLFTHQWYYFAAIIFISIIVGASKTLRENDAIRRIDALISISLIILIIVNR